MKILNVTLGALIIASVLAANPVMAENSLHREAHLPFVIEDNRAQAPFGQDMPSLIRHYVRAAPGVGTSGMISEGGMEAFAEHGFKTVVGLLTRSEGAEVHSGWAMNADIAYHALPVTDEVPGETAVKQFRQIVADPDNYPVMVYGAGNHRVGALWARYRMAMGVPVEVALQEGRTLGLAPAMEERLRHASDH
ncbi:MAG: hypothetical protein R3296_10570 [Oleiphilaceae bacterium]|nr:hypothetical protein [Oleiphilaceae bacterium]